MISHKEEVTNKILELVPKNCPACNHELILSEDLMHLYCSNNSCPGKFYRRLEIMAKAFGIENIGIKVAEELVASLQLTGLYEIYDLTVDDILKVERFQIGMAKKIYESIQDKREVTWEQFIRGIQLSRVGEGTARELSKKLASLDDLLSITPKELANIMDRATEELTSVIVNSISAQREEIEELAKRVSIVYPKEENAPSVKKDLSHITAVVTGKLEFGDRKTFQNKYNAEYGIKWGGDVSRTTNILVTNDTKRTGKMAKALALIESGEDIRIMSEEEFVNYVNSL